MTMPNMTGIELTSRLKEIRYDIPVIICTGFSEMIDEDKAKYMGISAYLMKPILKNELVGAIRKVLDGEKRVEDYEGVVARNIQDADTILDRIPD